MEWYGPKALTQEAKEDLDTRRPAQALRKPPPQKHHQTQQAVGILWMHQPGKERSQEWSPNCRQGQFKISPTSPRLLSVNGFSKPKCSCSCTRRTRSAGSETGAAAQDGAAGPRSELLFRLEQHFGKPIQQQNQEHHTGQQSRPWWGLLNASSGTEAFHLLN